MIKQMAIAIASHGCNNLGHLLVTPIRLLMHHFHFLYLSVQFSPFSEKIKKTSDKKFEVFGKCTIKVCYF